MHPRRFVCGLTVDGVHYAVTQISLGSLTLYLRDTIAGLFDGSLIDRPQVLQYIVYLFVFLLSHRRLFAQSDLQI